MPGSDPAAFAATFAALYTAHQVGDHWVQTSRQAARKGEPGPAGAAACAAHVLTYTVTAVVMLAGLWLATGVTGPGWRLLLGLAVSALTHYVADRRTPLQRLAEAIGNGPFYHLNSGGGPGSGSYALDQSWHIFWLFIAALIIV